MLGVFGQVHKLIGIGSVIIEFHGSILVGDQSPVTGPYRMVAEIGGCNGRMLSGFVWIIELRDQRNAFNPVVFGEFAQVHQCRVKIEQAGRFLACLARFNSGTGHQKRHTSRFFPKGTLGPVLFLTEMKTMITPQNNDGVIRIRACFQGGQYNPHAMIHKAHRRKISMGQASLIITSRNLGMRGGHGIVINGEEILRQVIKVTLWVIGQNDLILLIQFEPFWWNQ